MLFNFKGINLKSTVRVNLFNTKCNDNLFNDVVFSCNDSSKEMNKTTKMHRENSAAKRNLILKMRNCL